MTAIEVYRGGDLSSMTLDQLGEAAEHEAREIDVALGGALAHAIRLGEILIAARALAKYGEWAGWLMSHGISAHVCHNTTRLAHYKDKLPPEALTTWTSAKGRTIGPSPTRALAYVHGLPPVYQGINRHDETLKAEAVRLHGEGLSQRDIAGLLGVDKTSVGYWCNPKAYRENLKRQRNRAQQVRDALKAQRAETDRQAAVRAASPDVAKAYSLLRQALAQMSRSAESHENGSVRNALNDAIRLGHQSEDRLVSAMRLERQS